jgi:hypothetical protein
VSERGKHLRFPASRRFPALINDGISSRFVIHINKHLKVIDRHRS